MTQYTEICGWTLARAQARSGEPEQITGYLGKSDKFDRAVAVFSVTYADQVERSCSAAEGGAVRSAGGRHGGAVGPRQSRSAWQPACAAKSAEHA
jgi:hypothetical protein